MRLVEEDVAKIRPGVAEFDLARLAAVDFYGRQADRYVRFATVNAAGRLNPNDGVAPLIQAARLGFTTLYFVGVRRVMSLRRLMDGFYG